MVIEIHNKNLSFCSRITWFPPLWWRWSRLHFAGCLCICQLFPQNLFPCRRLSNGSFPPQGFCQPVARQHRIHLCPPQHSENNPRRVCAHMGKCAWRPVMQNPDAIGQKLAITELGKLMLRAKRRLTWLSGVVSELSKDNGSLKLGGEMRTRLGNWQRLRGISG